MTPRKIVAVISMYERRLRKAGVPKARMDPKRTLGSLNSPELLQHAYFLCDGVKKYIMTPGKEWKANRHLAAIQMSLSSAGWYTLEELMEHNRQKPAKMTVRK